MYQIKQGSKLFSNLITKRIPSSPLFRPSRKTFNTNNFEPDKNVFWTTKNILLAFVSVSIPVPVIYCLGVLLKRAYIRKRDFDECHDRLKEVNVKSVSYDAESLQKNFKAENEINQEIFTPKSIEDEKMAGDAEMNADAQTKPKKRTEKNERKKEQKKRMHSELKHAKKDGKRRKETEKRAKKNAKKEKRKAKIKRLKESNSQCRKQAEMYREKFEGLEKRFQRDLVKENEKRKTLMAEELKTAKETVIAENEENTFLRLSQLREVLKRVDDMKKGLLDNKNRINEKKEIFHLCEEIETVSQLIERGEPFEFYLRHVIKRSAKDPQLQRLFEFVRADHLVGVMSAKNLARRYVQDVERSTRMAIFSDKSSGFRVLLAYAFSFLLKNEFVYVEGENDFARLSRTGYFLKNGDVQRAVSEIDRLNGFSRFVCSGWFVEAKKYLELKQLLEISGVYLKKQLR